ncbi:hypothetical protein CWI36_0252p0040 [Hamiltosporidium magnivora]|uniref:Uncharacterized protein n=1 Tax=Hamiltosporidium magnivora TaxID=148818 RepID=A0A4Q9LHR2_9MICR|nr:hypothetical protein CWI36_0252p0040 [Hamiltosporidium magnivora]
MLSFEDITNFIKNNQEYFEQNEIQEIEKFLINAKTRKEEIRKENPNKEKANEYKEIGNKEFKNGNYEESIRYYTLGIEENPLNEIIFSNRAASYAKLSKNEEGIEDCHRALNINPSFYKAYIRLGSFYFDTDKNKAIEFYQKALEFDPENEICKSQINLLSSPKEESPNDFNINNSYFTEMLKNPEFKRVYDELKGKSPDELSDILKNLKTN